MNRTGTAIETNPSPLMKIPYPKASAPSSSTGTIYAHKEGSAGVQRGIAQPEQIPPEQTARQEEHHSDKHPAGGVPDVRSTSALRTYLCLRGNVGLANHTPPYDFTTFIGYHVDISAMSWGLSPLPK
jgi:hypothetical protein